MNEYLAGRDLATQNVVVGTTQNIGPVFACCLTTRTKASGGILTVEVCISREDAVDKFDAVCTFLDIPTEAGSMSCAIDRFHGMIAPLMSYLDPLLQWNMASRMTKRVSVV
jgi:hypothetical protein